MRAALLPLFCLAACSGESGLDNSPDVAGAANRAETAIAHYAAVTNADRERAADAAQALAGRPVGGPAAHAVAPRPPTVPAATPGPYASPTPAATDQGGVAGALALVQRYEAAIAAGDYHAAWSMWEGGGRASGMSAAAFATSFAPYARYKPTVGTPFDADAGAGQRFVSVPVTITGTLKTGAPFMLQGPIMLHRVSDDIETDDSRDHEWRISSSAIKPHPLPANRHPQVAE